METNISITEEPTIEAAGGISCRRASVAISGTLDGFVALDGQRTEMFSDVPEFTLGQYDHKGPFKRALSTYEGAKGNGFVLLHPEQAKDWNGQLWLVVHGAISYPPLGQLAPRKKGAYNRMLGRDDYVGLLLDKGAAVAFTRRASSIGPRDNETAVLDDGTVVGKLTNIYNPALIREFAAVAKRLVEERLGRAPLRSYLYGHSAGAGIAHLFNYAPGKNRDGQGKPIFDGFIADDAGNGFFLPTLMVDGKDVLFADAASRADFVPQIDLIHQAQVGEDGTSLWRKRENARLLLSKGLGDRSRSYEIAGSSHFDQGRVAWLGDVGLGEGAHTFADQNIDVGGVVDALADVLHEWVEGRREAPPTRSDDPDLGGGAIELPETACPLGVYYVYPEGTSGSRMHGQLTGFAAYDGTSLEPLDGRGELVDMNGNGIRDRRETVEAAWRRRGREGKRSGALRDGERLTKDLYVSSVEKVARSLAAGRLLSEAAAAAYVQQARAAEIGS